MNEEYDTVELTQEDLIESLELNMNDLTGRTTAIIGKLRQGLETASREIDDAERLAGFIASSLKELKAFMEKRHA